MTPRIVILGVGNLLMSDDGVGVHAVRTLAANPPPGAEAVDVGTDMLSALTFLENADRALIIDALCAGGKPGTVRLLSPSDLTALSETATLHAVNLLAGRHLLPPGTAWPEIAILGVEPAMLDYGIGLSPSVAAALPQVDRRCRELVSAWHCERSHPVNQGRAE